MGNQQQAADLGALGLDAGRMPRHVAIIMDGNGRWAQAQGKRRSAGHRAGVERLLDICRMTKSLGIGYLTVYAFSTENWSRPKQEVQTLMGLLMEFSQKHLQELMDNDVRLRIIGDLSEFEPRVRQAIDHCVTTTAQNRSLLLTLALGYGARAEILRAVRDLAAQAAAGQLAPEQIDEARFASYLYTAGMPDPDLIIRTSGEERLSNFLLYQAAYSEFVFVPEYWPDFDRAVYVRAIKTYQGRQRRYGGVGEGETV